MVKRLDMANGKSRVITTLETLEMGNSMARENTLGPKLVMLGQHMKVTGSIVKKKVKASRGTQMGTLSKATFQIM